MRRRKKKRKKRRKPKVISKVLKEATPLLLLTVIGGVFAGSVLGKMEDIFVIIPGVFVLVPAILGLRGNVGISFGSRLSTLLHLGLMKPSFRLTPLLLNNVFGALSLSFSFSAFFGILAHILCLLLHLPSAGITKLTIIGVMCGAFSSIVMIPFTTFLAFFSFKKGMDPDDIISPAVAVIGDGVAMVSIYFAAMLVRNLTLPDLSLLVIAILVIKEAFPARYRFFRIFLESSPVMLICGLLGVFAGLFLHHSQHNFGAAPYLFLLLPQLISKVGSIGSISGMRLTSGLYIGHTKPFFWNKYVWQNLIAALLLSLILVLPVALITHLAAFFLKIGKPDFIVLIVLTSIVMVPLSFGTSLTSFLTASISKRISLDPCNVVAPLITSIGDVSAVFLFVFLLQYIK
jgi:mgtE-like transporter